VQSAELNLAQRLGLQNLQVSVFLAGWDGLITTRGVVVDGKSLKQFSNIKNIVSAGVNVGWRGASGPVDWSVSANYAPGRARLPADVASWTDEQLNDLRLQRAGVDRFGTKLFGMFLMPSEGVPDFYSHRPRPRTRSGSAGRGSRSPPR